MIENIREVAQYGIILTILYKSAQNVLMSKDILNNKLGHNPSKNNSFDTSLALTADDLINLKGGYEYVGEMEATINGTNKRNSSQYSEDLLSAYRENLEKQLEFLPHIDNFEPGVIDIESIMTRLKSHILDSHSYNPNSSGSGCGNSGCGGWC